MPLLPAATLPSTSLLVLVSKKDAGVNAKGPDITLIPSASFKEKINKGGVIGNGKGKLPFLQLNWKK